MIIFSELSEKGQRQQIDLMSLSERKKLVKQLTELSAELEAKIKKEELKAKIKKEELKAKIKKAKLKEQN